MPGLWSRIRGSFARKVALTIALVVLGDWLFFQQGRTHGAFGMYGLAMLLALALAHPAVIRHHLALSAWALAALFAFATVHSPSVIAWMLFWGAAVMAVLLPRAGRFDDGWRWFQRLVGHALTALPGPIPDWLRGKRVRRIRRTAKSRAILPIVLLPAVGSIVFLWLFAAANPVIEAWLASFSFPGIEFTTLLRLSLWAILVWPAWAIMRPRLTRPAFGTFDGSGDIAIPGVSAASVTLSLFAFNGIFLVQNAMDAAWLWHLVPLPATMTLAEYAHRGAYPLVATALLAALFVLVALRPGSATVSMPAIRKLVALWIAQNLFLVFNAALRTFDYVEAYSLTVLRISALLWMLLVAIGLVLVLWRMLAGKSSAWLINTNLAAAGALLTGVCFVDLGAIAAEWNVRHAREVDGTGARLDLCYLNELGDSALLPLLELERLSLPTDLRARVSNVRSAIHARLAYRMEDGGWDWQSARRLEEANSLAREPAAERDFEYGMACDGRPYPPPRPPVPAPAPEAAPGTALTGALEP